MPIQIQCPACDKKLKVPDEFLGKTVRCPSCKKAFAATAPAEEKEDAERKPVTPRGRRDDDDEAHERKQAPRPAPRDEDDAPAEDEDRPRRRARRDEDEDYVEEDQPRRRARRDEEEDYEEEEDRPRRRTRGDEEEDEDEDRPRRRARRDEDEHYDEEEDDRPRRRARRDDDEDDYEDEDRPRRRKGRRSASQAARDAVAAPAICLMAVGGLTIVSAIVYVLLGVMEVNIWTEMGIMKKSKDPSDSGGLLLYSILGGVIIACVGGVIISGAFKMKNLESYGYALAGIIAAMLCGPSLLGIPIGIWAIIALNKPEVKRAMGRE
jgi:hypothetical protein